MVTKPSNMVAPVHPAHRATMTTKGWLLVFAAILVALGEAFPRPSASPRTLTTRAWERREATFGMGCFWKPSEELLKVPGVIDSVVGYTGNDRADLDNAPPPSYDSVCFGTQWVEGVRVVYDDDQLSYTQLLDAFFETQQPKVGSRQYASIVFPHDADQEAEAREWLAQAQGRVRRDGVYGAMTTIEPLTPFYRAEGYHQRYWQKMRPRFAAVVGLMAVASGALDSILPDAAARSSVHTISNDAVLLGCAYILLERVFDAQVVKLS